VTQHVSAANLQNLDTPTLRKTNRWDTDNKNIWNQSYDEEYCGLQDLPTWTTISSSKYNKIKHIVGDVLPAMDLLTVKYDEHGKPKQDKWRIVALGNLDPYEWSINDFFAPVISMVELRFMTVSLTVKYNFFLLNGNVKQAFCQAVLPPDKQYVLRPLVRCPNTPAKSYWLLKRALYGLKYSPRPWFQQVTRLLSACGLHSTPNNSCLFEGKPYGFHDLYLGLYVDDFIYFSPNHDTKIIFEHKLRSLSNVDFMGLVSHFLGIKFVWRHQEDNHLDVYLS